LGEKTRDAWIITGLSGSPPDPLRLSLDEPYPLEGAQRQFETVVDWGRYAELFEYDASAGTLYLAEDPLEPAGAG
jgi:hypothetical protein